MGTIVGYRIRYTAESAGIDVLATIRNHGVEPNDLYTDYSEGYHDATFDLPINDYNTVKKLLDGHIYAQAIIEYTETEKLHMDIRNVDSMINKLHDKRQRLTYKWLVITGEDYDTWVFDNPATA